MKKSFLSQFAKDVHIVVTKHSPEILTGIGIAGWVTATILAVKATPRALTLVEEERIYRRESIEEGIDERLVPEKISNVDIFKLTWKCYIPAAVTGVVSTACLIGASSVNIKRNAALATAYALSETALKEYQEKVVETIGEKKEQAVRDSIAKDKIEHNPVSSREVIITEKGNTLCYDVISGRYFKSDIDALKKVENELNRQMMSDMYISVNDFYYEIGLSPTKQGDELGWNIDRGFISLSFSSQLAEDGTPCLVVDYKLAPRYDYTR